MAYQYLLTFTLVLLVLVLLPLVLLLLLVLVLLLSCPLNGDCLFRVNMNSPFLPLKDPRVAWFR